MAVGRGSIKRASLAGEKDIVKPENKREGEQSSKNIQIESGSEKRGLTYESQEMLIARVPVQCLEGFEQREHTDLSLLQSSIRTYGILQPLLVWKREENQFLVLDGVKRMEVVKKLSFDFVPVIVLELDNDQQAKTIFEELKRYATQVEELKKYEVISSIRSSVPAHLL